MLPFSKISTLACSFFLLALLFFLGCSNADMNCNSPVGSWSQRGASEEITLRFPISVSLVDASAIPKVFEIQRRVFCLNLNNGTVYYLNSFLYQVFAPSSVSPPCFQLMPGQTYYDEFPHTKNSYDVIDPEQFLFYYKSIPPELNRFLAIKIDGLYSSMLSVRDLQNNVHYVEPAIPAGLWPSNFQSLTNYKISDDATQLSLYGLLHNLVVKGGDLYIYVYLPLNIGIKTPAYNGVLMKKERFKTEINNFANPEYRLRPSLRQNLELSAYRPIDQCEGYGLSKANFPLTITPAMLRSVLMTYENAVKDYLSRHSDASFTDPYAQP